MSYNGNVFPTSSRPKAKAKPYLALSLGLGETGPAGLGLEDVSHQPVETTTRALAGTWGYTNVPCPSK